MKKLILHIGNHKTGTTSIQKALHLNRSLLSKEGFDVFAYGRGLAPLESGACHSIVQYAREEHVGNADFYLPLVNLLCESERNVIVSTENLSWVTQKKPIEDFFNCVSQYFDEIKIVVYLRRQDKHMISHVQESSKPPLKPAARFFNFPTDILPKHESKFDLYLDYYKRLKMWADIFGKKNIVVKVFEKNNLKNGDAVLDFFDVLGVSGAIETARVNESLGFSETKMGLLVNHKNAIDSDKKFFIKLAGKSERRLPSRQRAVEFYENYKESNEKLEKYFSVTGKEVLFDESFEEYPDISEDVWSPVEYEDILKSVMSESAKRFSQIYSKRVLVLGDSHTKVFEIGRWRELTPAIYWDVVSVEGATLSGLSNPNSKTQSMPIFNWALSKNNYKAVVFQLGEVDLGFVIHYRAKFNNSDVTEAFNKAIENYKSLVLAARKKAPVVVMSTCLPTISDESVGDVVNARKEVDVSQLQRTEMSVKFNKVMHDWCVEQGIHFIDFDIYTLGPDGLIKKEFLNKNEADHNYDKNNFVKLINKHLLPVLRNEINRKVSKKS